MARRIHPIRVTKEASLGQLTAFLRDQVWAEAVARYRAGETTWELTPDLFAELKVALRERNESEQDPWIDPLATYLETKEEVRAADVLLALQVPTERHTTHLLRRCARILRSLGWGRQHTRAGKVWRPAPVS